MPFLGTTGGGSVKQFGGQANLGYFIKNSLRFRSSASAYLNRTPASATNRTTWTWSGWVKRGTLSSLQFLFQQGADQNNATSFQFNSSNTLEYNHADSGVNTDQCVTSAVFRDPSAWYHIVLSVDTTQATDTNRVKIYVNGNLQTLGTANYPAQNVDTDVNTANPFRIGSQVAGTPYYLDGYLTEINFIDGQALTPSSFGKTDAATNQWIPKKFAGTYGTNGFYLKFADASAATAAAIGKDSSGNGNNWTPNNISVTSGATYDAMIDSPTRSGAASNYCVINPLDKGTSYYPTLSYANLYYVAGYNTQNPARGTLAVTTGKYYFEATIVTRGYNPMVGVMTISSSLGTGDNFKSLWGTQAAGWSSFTGGGNGIVSNGSSSAYGTAMASGDVIMVAFDVDNGKFYVGKNGNWNDSANPAAGTGNQATFAHTDPITPFFDGTNTAGTADTWAVNFGQRPFLYTPPSGFKSLNTFNLP